ncbi:MAG: DUF1367 family protein [candidate division Zixibacteria bacterium]|nr:DUF1367 family protein [candidate division Zixibacteria bacterium]
MDIRLSKTVEGFLIPVDDESQEFVLNLKAGQVIHADFKKERNYKFHRKWWALVKYAFDHWDVVEFQTPKWEGLTPEKSLDRFRKDLTILAGYYEATHRLNGEVRIEAKSISFGKMNAEEFEELYSNTIDVVLKHVLKNYDKDELERVVEQVLGFAG